MFGCFVYDLLATAPINPLQMCLVRVFRVIHTFVEWIYCSKTLIFFSNLTFYQDSFSVSKHFIPEPILQWISNFGGWQNCDEICHSNAKAVYIQLQWHEIVLKLDICHCLHLGLFLCLCHSAHHFSSLLFQLNKHSTTESLSLYLSLLSCYISSCQWASRIFSFSGHSQKHGTLFISDYP